MDTDTGAGPLSEAQQLQQMMTQMLGQINNMQAKQAEEREATRQQIEALQGNLAALQDKSTPATTPSVQDTIRDTDAIPPVQTKKKATLPDPPRFDGNRKEFPSWYLEMEYKLQTDGPAIGSSKDQFAYVFSRLEKGARSTATAFAQHGGNTSAYSPTEFLTYLKSCYGDPNQKQSALGRLTRLHQGD